MTCACEHLDACLPVTALHVLDVPGAGKLVLSGCGPSVFLNEEESGRLLGCVRVFDRNNVHGIELVASSAGCHCLLVWGARSLRLIRLNLEWGLTPACREHVAPDWILNVSICAEGTSAGIGLITANNVLLGMTAQNLFTGDALIDMREVASGLNSVLYSADITWLSPNTILIAAGTVFGEIVVWSCILFDSHSFSCSSAVIHNLFTGHEGSIFGVTISPEINIAATPVRLLASCSDDRTIRVWNVSDSLDASESAKSKLTRPRSTGFGNVHRSDLEMDAQSSLAMAWGHLSRIWGVRFLDWSVLDGILSYNLISRGEDATAQLWNLRLSTDFSVASLKNVSKYDHHSGKNIWALDVVENRGSFDIYTGAADGSVVTFEVDKNMHYNRVRTESYQSSDIFETAEDKLIRYAFLSATSIMAISSQGQIRLGTIFPEHVRNKEPLCTWEVLANVDTLKQHSVIASDSESGLAILGGTNGVLWLYTHGNKELRRIASTGLRVSSVFLLKIPGSLSFVVSYMGSKIVDLFLADPTAPEQHTKTVLDTPRAFIVISAAFIDYFVVLGGRGGSVLIYDTPFSLGPGPVPPAATIGHVHGKDAVTSIIRLPRSPNPKEHCLLTTGRDGTYSAHALTFDREAVSGSPPLTFTTLHCSTASFGSSIEGAHLDSHTGNLLLTGFRATEFTAWNESAQRRLTAVDCGGAHRTWAYHHHQQQRSQQGGVDTAADGPSAFAWTRASTFNLAVHTQPAHRAIWRGGHGREIKAAAIGSMVLSDGRTRRRILATGAEDTTIRLFFVDEANHGQNPWKVAHGLKLNCARILKKHTAGLQQLQWSPCGRFLFSSGGLEEFFVWRVRTVPGLGIGAVCEGQAPRSASQSDLRIVGFDVADIGERESDGEGEDGGMHECGQKGGRRFLLCLAYSNSTVKLFTYAPALPLSRTGGAFHLLAQGRYTANCLTQIRFISLDIPDASNGKYAPQPRPVGLITASTDGMVAVWSMPADLGLRLGWDLPGSTNDDDANDSYAGDRKPGLESDNVPIATLDWQVQHVVHQSSVKALELLPCSLPFSGASSTILLLTGGDDNALSLTPMHLHLRTCEYRPQTRSASTVALTKDAPGAVLPASTESTKGVQGTPGRGGLEADADTPQESPELTPPTLSFPLPTRPSSSASSIAITTSFSRTTTLPTAHAAAVTGLAVLCGCSPCSHSSGFGSGSGTGAGPAASFRRGLTTPDSGCVPPPTTTTTASTTADTPEKQTPARTQKFTFAFVLASTSNDQRMKIWRVQADVDVDVNVDVGHSGDDGGDGGGGGNGDGYSGGNNSNSAATDNDNDNDADTGTDIDISRSNPASASAPVSVHQSPPLLLPSSSFLNPAPVLDPQSEPQPQPQQQPVPGPFPLPTQTSILNATLQLPTNPDPNPNSNSNSNSNTYPYPYSLQLRVRRLRNVASAVADAGALETFSTATAAGTSSGGNVSVADRIVVCGVGIEVWGVGVGDECLQI